MKSKWALFILSILFFQAGLHAQDLSLEWVRNVSGGGQELGTSVAIDADENIFVVGSFRDTVEVNTANGPVQLISKGLEDMFILKIKPSGEVLWCKHIGGKASLGGRTVNIDPYQQALFSVQTDADGNVYITGDFKDTVDFDPGPGEEIRYSIYYELDTGDPEMGGFIKDNYENTFLLKLNNDGDFQWVRTFFGKPNSAFGISVDDQDESVFIVGRFQDTVDVNERKGTDFLISKYIFDTLQKPPYDAFIAKFSLDGDFRWAKAIGNNKRGNEAIAIHADGKGFLYITGQYTDSADFNQGHPGGRLRSLNPAAIGPNIFVAKYDVEGNYVWAKGMGSVTANRSTRGSAITTDPSGNILLTGFFQGVGIFDPANFNNANARITGARGVNAGLSCFVAKLDSAGSFVWAKGLTSTYVDQGTGIATDDEGSVYTVGYFGGSGNFNPNTGPAQTLSTPKTTTINGFISKLDADGNYEWARSIYGGTGRAQSIAVSQGRNVYATGYFSETSDFNRRQGSPVEIVSKGMWDAWVMKLSCTDTNSLSLTHETCANVYELNGMTYHESGIYKQRFSNASGCDSVIVLDLTLNKMDEPIIKVDGFELSTSSPFATYQWLLNGTAIAGATSRQYTVMENGIYAVAVTTEEGCADTSDIYEVSNIVGIHPSFGQVGGLIRIYPNPAQDMVYLETPKGVNVTITSVEGKVLRRVSNTNEISLKGLAKGLYLFHIISEDGALLKVEKIIKAGR